MSRYLLFGLTLMMGATSTALAQRIVTTRVFTEPAGARFYVDGVPYKSAQAFNWTEGSKHTISTDIESAVFPGERMKFTGWTDSVNTPYSNAESIVVSANSAITFIRINFTKEYLLRVLFYGCTEVTPGECRPPGTVFVGGSAFTSDIEQWLPAGSTVQLSARPGPGFVFVNWGHASGFSTAFSYTHRLTSPTTFSNIFAPAKRVTLLSEPTDLLLAPDRSPTRAPMELDWGMGTTHILGAVSPQAERDNSSRLWVFSHWSNGAKMNDPFVVANNTTPETLTGHFVRGAQVSFVTNPAGLRLRVEGRENWPAYNFVWGAGMKYQVSAPPDQVDSRGRRWVFKGWSNQGPAAQEIQITPEHVNNGFRLIANYESQSRLSITTVPPNMPLMIDGTECRANCSIDREAGAQVRISAPEVVSLSDTSRLEFQGWSDGGDPARTFTFTDRLETNLVVSYRSMHRLVTVAEPGEKAALFRVEPASGDGFYQAETSVTVTAEARPGFRFRRWDGDLAGTFRTGALTMSVPRVVRAVFDPVPYADPAGVRNAAGETPEIVVAPGSIASVVGINLAADYELGPQNPLAQAIGGVTVRLGNRLMPMVFVSPEQINFQVPSDLGEGVHQIAVRWNSNPEVTSSMRIVRNAPGVFTKALHADGREITANAPAKRGDTVAIFGTGFGPYERVTIDGFPLPASPSYPTLDPVEIWLGDRQVETTWAGGVAGQIGVATARFRLPEDLAVVDNNVPVRIRINGRDSNTVTLRVE
ncbi:MAG: hypothetical protein JNL98_18760 [Bryobacterales bacterium]|nr:hypothetical protein [Bryobacterales bacterium]